MPPAGDGSLERVGWLTPYTVEAITEDVVRAGRGTKLELIVSEEVSPNRVRELRDEFAQLARRGVHLAVRRGDGRSAPHAAA